MEFEDWLDDWTGPLMEAFLGRCYYIAKQAEDDAMLASIAAVYAEAEGENDGPDWLCVVELTDGRFAYVVAGCDMTGWDCQASGNVVYANSLDEIRSELVMDDEGRERLVWRDEPLRRY